MKPRKKDNFTDAVEALERNNTSKTPPGPQQELKKNDQQVRDNEGNLVTLGQNGQNQTPVSNNRKVIELSPEDLEAIKETMKSALDHALERFVKNKDINKNR